MIAFGVPLSYDFFLPHNSVEVGQTIFASDPNISKYSHDLFSAWKAMNNDPFIAPTGKDSGGKCTT
jgi:hypothetical protein